MMTEAGIGERGQRIIKKVVKGLLLVMVVGILFNMFTQRVDGGYTCAVKTFGKATGSAGPGIHFQIPIVNSYSCYNGRMQTLNVLMVEGIDSSATYDEPAIEGVTNTSVGYKVSLTMNFYMPTENVQNLYNNVGRTNQAVFDNAIKERVRTITRQVLNTHSADELYFGQLEQLSTEILAKLTPSLAENGIRVQYFGLKEFQFEESYTSKIREKNAEIENKQLVILKGQTEAEEQKKLLIKKQGEADQLKIDAQAQADAERIRQQGIADGIESIGKAEAAVLQSRATVINENPSLITWEQIGALRDANTIYLPSDTGILPILNLETAEPDIS